jgi:hypothetical protein
MQLVRLQPHRLPAVGPSTR